MVKEKMVKEKVAMNVQFEMPKFGIGSVPVSTAARVYGKDATWVRAGLISGWLPIGYAVRNGERVTDLDKECAKEGRINFYISPIKLWEDTGYVWKGDRDGD